jgi:hypothetical protein
MYKNVPYKKNEEYEPVLFTKFITLITNTIRKNYSQNPHPKQGEKRGIGL